MTNKNLYKVAAAAIEQLQDQLQEKTAQLEHYEEVVKLAFDLLENGLIAAEDLKDKINELNNIDTEKLKVIQNSIEYSKTASMREDGFKLSSQTDVGDGSDAATRFINSLIDD